MNQDEKTVEPMAAAIKPLFVTAGLWDLDAEDYAWDAARAALAALKETKPAAEDIVARHLEDFGARLTEQPHQDYLAALKSTMLAAVKEALS